jgi:hypothetical protein
MRSSVRFQWAAPAGQAPRWWFAQTRRGGVWQTEILPAETHRREFPAAPDVIIIRAVDRFGNLSEARALGRPNP